MRGDPLDVHPTVRVPVSPQTRAAAARPLSPPGRRALLAGTQGVKASPSPSHLRRHRHRWRGGAGGLWWSLWSARQPAQLTHTAGASSPQRPRPAGRRRGPPPARSLPAHAVTQAGGTAPAPAIATAATPGTEVCWPWAT